MNIAQVRPASPAHKLLLDSPPLVIQKELAVALNSLDKAVVLQQLHYLLRIARKSKNEYVFKNGRWWVYNSYRQWQEDHFPFWSESKIGRVFRELEKDGLVESSQMDAYKYDQRKWYAINYDALNCFLDKWCTVDDTKMARSTASECDAQRCQPDTIMSKTTPKTTTDTSDETLPERDYLTDVIAFAQRQSGEQKKPRGWTAATDNEFEVCRRVAYHWRAAILPKQARVIEASLAGARELLDMHDDDVRATLLTVDRYRQDYEQNKRDFTVSGPHSLVNEIPAFLGRKKSGGGSENERIAQKMAKDPQWQAFAKLNGKD